MSTSDLIKRYNNIRDNEVEQEILKKQKLRRQIEDYLRKYSTYEQLQEVAKLLGIKGE